jgi:hypothetical protein
MDISFAYIRARMREICTGHHVGPVGPTPGHVVMCWHTGCHVSMTPHQSKRSTSRRIRRRHVYSTRIQGPTTRANCLQTAWAPRTVIRGHISVSGRKHNPKHGGPRSAYPTLRRFTSIFHVSSPHWILRVFPWCLRCSRVVTRAYK